MCKKTAMQIKIMYLYHLVFIIISFMLMKQYIDGLLAIGVIADVLLLIWLIAKNIKTYIPWIVYLHFAIGTAVEITLNLTGVIPKDIGWFQGLGQLFYIFLLVAHLILIGIANLILWVLHRKIKGE